MLMEYDALNIIFFYLVCNLVIFVFMPAFNGYYIWKSAQYGNFHSNYGINIKHLLPPLLWNTMIYYNQGTSISRGHRTREILVLWV